MTRNMMHDLVHWAVENGYTLKCGAPCEFHHDYSGTDPLEAVIALEACDEMLLFLTKEGAQNETALIVNEHGNESENVCDFNPAEGFIGTFFDRWTREQNDTPVPTAPSLEDALENWRLLSQARRFRKCRINTSSTATT